MKKVALTFKMLDKNSKIEVLLEYKGDTSNEIREFLDDVYDITHLWAFETKKDFIYSFVLGSNEDDIMIVDHTDWKKDVNIYDIFVSAMNGEEMNTASLTPYEMEHLITDSINKLLCQK